MKEKTENDIGEAGKQRAVAYAMVRGQKPVEEVLEEFGVSEAEFAGWVTDGRFTDYAASLARGYAEADVPYVWKVLRGMAFGESIPAIRLYFDLLGKKPAGHGTEAAETIDLAGLRGSIFGAEGAPEEGA